MAGRAQGPFSGGAKISLEQDILSHRIIAETGGGLRKLPQHVGAYIAMLLIQIALEDGHGELQDLRSLHGSLQLGVDVLVGLEEEYPPDKPVVNTVSADASDRDGTLVVELQQHFWKWMWIIWRENTIIHNWKSQIILSAQPVLETLFRAKLKNGIRGVYRIKIKLVIEKLVSGAFSRPRTGDYQHELLIIQQPISQVGSILKKITLD
ncbi:hypothetical protein SS50377_25261 [Spironucleus salmonicida]|uniref:Uncharacterized protein n=1 Tax=Spironucleus salmonicida TaxID=348837 RepID=V6LC96_9EUKA|nr:hypothetical protein SS50377_25261 [Spironucleus salmonicida]|eukprot:EST41858.1 Hypothetical protein SS50377_18694 [Spironucleus salmonicida]